MKVWARYLIGIAAGVVIGTGSAAIAVRAGALGNNERIGAWSTGKDFGTVRASNYTRAVVALYGLLALPANEARYYTASVDDAGQPLDGKCRYRVIGGRLPSKWWSLTLYDPAGYLVPNRAGIYSINSIALPTAEQAAWQVSVAPLPQTGHWLPTGPGGRFALTLRMYLPDDGGVGNLSSDQLPRIVRQSC